MPNFLHSIDPDQLVAHHAWMRRLARSLVLDDSEADDVVQEAWLKATQKPPEKPGALRAWLATVVRNAAKQLARGESRRDKRELAAARPEALPPTAELVARAESRRMLLDATLGLSEPGRSTVLLRFYEGLPPREIAKRQGVPVETVRSRVRRALGEMRSQLDREHDGNRQAWGLALLPLAAPPLTGAIPPVGEATTPTVPIAEVAAPWAAAATLVVAGGAAGWIASTPEADAADLVDLRAQIRDLERETTELSAHASTLAAHARANRDSAGRIRAQIGAATRQTTAPRLPRDEVATTSSAAPRQGDSASSFAFPAHHDLLVAQDWDAEGQAFAELIRTLRRVSDPIAAGDTPTPEVVGELQVRNGPVIALALRLKAGGIEGSIPNVVLAHPAVLSNLLPPTMEALGVALTPAQVTALRRAAQDGLDAVERARAEIDDRTILIRRMAVEAAALGPWLEAVDGILDPRQRSALRPEASRGRAGLDLVSPGLLWPSTRSAVMVDAADEYVEALDRLLLAPAFAAGTTERENARRILEDWAATLPANAFGSTGTSLDAYGFTHASRAAFWAERTADLLENLRDRAAVTPAQKERLARRLMPIVPLVPIALPGGSPR